MPLILPPGYAQVTLIYLGGMFDSGNAATVFGLGEPLGPEPTPLDEAAVGIGNAFADNLAPQLDSDVVLDRILLVTETESFEANVPIPGTASGLAPPTNVALLVRKNTTRRGRRAQGRMFLPAMLRQADVNEDGTLTTPAFNTQQAAVNGFYSQMQTETGSPMVILQNSTGVTPPITPPPVVTSLQVDPKVATQRRRLRA